MQKSNKERFVFNSIGKEKVGACGPPPKDPKGGLWPPPKDLLRGGARVSAQEKSGAYYKIMRYGRAR